MQSSLPQTSQSQRSPGAAPRPRFCPALHLSANLGGLSLRLFHGERLPHCEGGHRHWILRGMDWILFHDREGVNRDAVGQHCRQIRSEADHVRGRRLGGCVEHAVWAEHQFLDGSHHALHPRLLQWDAGRRPGLRIGALQRRTAAARTLCGRDRLGIGTHRRPCRGWLLGSTLKFPSVFASGSLFDRFPYLLQALCISSIAVFGLFVVCLLPETLHRKSSVPKVEDLEKSNPLDSKEDKVESIFRNWPLMAATTLYCLWSLHDMAYSELFSLWSVSPKSYGGLGFTSSQVGSVLAVAGCAMLGAQLGVFPTVCRMVGPIRACRFGALITIPLLVAYPYFGRIQGPWLSVTVYAAAILKYILTTAVLTGSFILINNCVKQRQRGAANGFSLSIVSVFKGLGPAIGGIVFSCAQKRQHSWFFPGDHLVFLFLNVFALLTVLTSFEPFLPKSANRLIADD
ncbi:protein ZINC INDUCED FACILITATOR-LIKE 1 isoform X2 [Selaginella moellendorffii]|uniref:protein ZINC INDUCED FACILITATOR-LIKE 1 isoform X2 n=1 Tax=Selaginella moellendorffii TaxID=88036 RepID=UPI000D1CDDA4|nr:protein ZINC INDUCED FACILITATOR-LIKE 1 isoform X2 [Selaginella moellendorffii]|eukprot:XP_024527438.1 protein ZINC INDUCED FACILITATOR-LIKE 1 isoform X2 [Selaginella moellendorffii]